MLLEMLKRLMGGDRGHERKARRVRPLLEALEDRTALATFTWTGSAGTDWYAAANWTKVGQGGDYPVYDDTAVFANNKDCVYTGNGMSASLLHLTGDYTGRLKLTGEHVVVWDLLFEGGTIELSSLNDSSTGFTTFEVFNDASWKKGDFRSSDTVTAGTQTPWLRLNGEALIEGTADRVIEAHLIIPTANSSLKIELDDNSAMVKFGEGSLHEAGGAFDYPNLVNYGDIIWKRGRVSQVNPTGLSKIVNRGDITVVAVDAAEQPTLCQTDLTMEQVGVASSFELQKGTFRLGRHPNGQGEPAHFDAYLGTVDLFAGTTLKTTAMFGTIGLGSVNIHCSLEIGGHQGNATNLEVSLIMRSLGSLSFYAAGNNGHLVSTQGVQFLEGSSLYVRIDGTQFNRCDNISAVRISIEPASQYGEGVAVHATTTGTPAAGDFWTILTSLGLDSVLNGDFTLKDLAKPGGGDYATDVLNLGVGKVYRLTA